MSFAHQSFWGVPTASLDWCEVNYAYTPFIAEFWNTITSLWLTVLATFGMYHGLKLKAKKRVHIAYAALGVVGIGSALFHATLLYSCQLLDELPMIYGTLIFLYALLEFEKHTIFDLLFIPLLVSIGVAVTVLMLIHSDSPQLHQVAYAILVFILVFRALYITYRTHITRVEFTNLQYLLWYSAFVFGVGYLLWLTERKLCRNGSVVPGLQFHSFWHILTGTGTFGFIQFITYYLLKDRTTDVELKYLLGVIPYITKRDKKDILKE